MKAILLSGIVVLLGSCGEATNNQVHGNADLHQQQLKASKPFYVSNIYLKVSVQNPDFDVIWDDDRPVDADLVFEDKNYRTIDSVAVKIKNLGAGLILKAGFEVNQYIRIMGWHALPVKSLFGVYRGARLNLTGVIGAKGSFLRNFATGAYITDGAAKLGVEAEVAYGSLRIVKKEVRQNSFWNRRLVDSTSL